MPHYARKRFGQHFLRDEHVIERIVETINPQKNEAIIEIGPGHGAITKPLLQRDIELHVIELDRDLIGELRKLNTSYPTLNVIQQDALQLDVQDLTSEKIRVVGNLPYNISSPLLFHLFTQRDLIKDMTFMLQKEVVARICAEVGTSAYSRLSVMAQYMCEVSHVFDVPPTAFSPPPRVDSAIVTLRPKEPEPGLDEQLFARVVQKAFSQRRKMIRNNLGDWFEPQDFADADIATDSRPQTLHVDHYISLTRCLMKYPGRYS